MNAGTFNLVVVAVASLTGMAILGCIYAVASNHTPDPVLTYIAGNGFGILGTILVKPPTPTGGSAQGGGSAA